MTREFWIAGLCSLFLALLSQLPASPVHAQSAAQLEAQIATHNKQIADLQAEIARYQKELNVLATKKNTLQSTIDTLALEQKQLATKIQVTQNKISAANLQLSELSLSIRDTESSIESNEIAIAKTLRTTAQKESSPLIIAMLHAESLGDAWSAIDAAAQLNRALREDIKTLETAKVELSDHRDAVAKTKSELVALQTQLSTEKRSVDASKNAQQKLLSETKNQEANYQKLIAAKQAEQSAFQAALFELATQLQYVVDPKRIPPAGKGVLGWPVDNVFITQEFGETVAAQRLYTTRSHNGMDFRASIGTPIRASASGTVIGVNLGAVKYCQYGKWVLIKHANGLATLYAHLSEVDVQKGSIVTRGQVIGLSGDTGYATGPHLHFGVYLAEALAFKEYTCKSGYTVTIPVAPIPAYLNPMSYL